MKKLKAGILGATGVVGQQFVKILSKHPYFEVTAVTGSSKSSGKTYGDATDWSVTNYLPETISEQNVLDTDANVILRNDIDLVFSALPASIAYNLEDKLASSGIPVFSNASAHRMRESVPILIPEINPGHLKLVSSQQYDGGFIVTNSNCSTSGLVFGLKPLMEFGIRDVIVTTYQAVSGAGRRGVGSMDILGNVIPFISNEETKIEQETRLILGKHENERIIPAQFDVNASCARVPVLNGHLESVVVQLEDEFSVNQVIDAYNSFRGEPQALELPTAPSNPIVVRLESDRPQPTRDLSLHVGDLGMAVKIGRVRKHRNRLNFFLLVHNAIRGAAGASVLNAEFARAKGVLE
ncbi:MAG: aspartate-semialdehyde dehydrogenase [Candidatus Thorarchaeota archaeon]